MYSDRMEENQQKTEWKIRACFGSNQGKYWVCA